MMKNEQENRNEKLTLYDGILAALYVIIIAIGIVMCATHGLGGTLTHLVIISLCICGVFAVKLIKYRRSFKAYIHRSFECWFGRDHHRNGFIK